MRKLIILITATVIMAQVSCKRNSYDGDNPFFYDEWSTPFGMPPFNEILPSHYMPAFEEAFQRHAEEIDEIVNNRRTPDFENVIYAFDRSGSMLERVASVFFAVSGADTNDQLQEIEREIMPLLSQHYDNIYLNEDLFDKVAEVYVKREQYGLDPLQRRLTEKTYDKFVKAGAMLTPQGKDALRSINEQLAGAMVSFSNNVLDANRNFAMIADSTDVEGLPIAVREAAAAEAEKRGHKNRFAFTLSKPSMFPFLMNSQREDLRKTLYEGYLNRCNYDDPTDNRANINEIVRLRGEKARLLGYKDFAEYQLSDRMARDSEAVYDLLNELWEPALASAGAELDEMRDMKAREGKGRNFEPSDWFYYAEKVRKQKYSLDEESLKPYFSLSNVQTGIFYLCNRLYGLTFKPLSKMPVYNKECVVYEVFDVDGSHLGLLLMDFHPREGKSQGAWCGVLSPRKYENGKKVADPIVTIVCNFTRPSGNRPALLNLDETETFFHEFGHAVHMLFVDVPYQGLSEVEQDFVELPSQIMENWALEPEMLRTYALHYNSGTPISENLISRIEQSRYFNQGFATTEYLAAALIDMDIHTLPEYTELDVNEFERNMLNERRGLMSQIAPRYRYPYFNHIFGSSSYAAGYYSYIWAEVLDKDAYEAFVNSGDLFDRSVALSFRKNILEKGGSEDGMTMYRNFRRAEPTGEYLLYARGLKERPERPAEPERMPLPENEIPPLDPAEIMGPGSGYKTAESSSDSLSGTQSLIENEELPAIVSDPIDVESLSPGE